MSNFVSTDRLGRLATSIDSDLGDVDELPTGDSASIVRVLRNGEVAVRSLDGIHPYDALLGFVAPEDWEVLGVIAPGWGTAPDSRGRANRRRVRVIHLIARYGDEASVIRFAGQSATTLNESPVGRVADCLRRALNLATPAPPEDGLVALSGERMLQRLAARAHPCFAGRLVTEDEVAGIVDAALVTSWEDERWANVAAGDDADLDPTIAAWMDNGMYARWVMAGLLDPNDLMQVAKAACTPGAWSAALLAFIETTGGTF